MQRLLLLFIAFALHSCDLFGPKVPNREELVQKELQTLDWNDVDRYPLFAHCDETAPKGLQKRCFSMALAEHFYETLESQELSVYQNLQDTVWVKLHIDQKGSVFIDSVLSTERVREGIPQLDSLLQLGVQTLPRIYPALKRDVPVSTRMILPLAFTSG